MLDTQGYRHTHSGCAVLIAFPQQEWLHERVSMLRYTCIGCPVVAAVAPFFSLRFHMINTARLRSYFQVSLTQRGRQGSVLLVGSQVFEFTDSST
jgi:hypothetical protein